MANVYNASRLERWFEIALRSPLPGLLWLGIGLVLVAPLWGGTQAEEVENSDELAAAEIRAYTYLGQFIVPESGGVDAPPSVYKAALAAADVPLSLLVYVSAAREAHLLWDGTRARTEVTRSRPFLLGGRFAVFCVILLVLVWPWIARVRLTRGRITRSATLAYGGRVGLSLLPMICWLLVGLVWMAPLLSEVEPPRVESAAAYQHALRAAQVRLDDVLVPEMGSADAPPAVYALEQAAATVDLTYMITVNAGTAVRLNNDGSMQFAKPSVSAPRPAPASLVVYLLVLLSLVTVWLAGPRGGPLSAFRRPRRGDSLVRIFLSYRRDDSTAITERIHDRLAAAFGQNNVYRDTEAIPLGSPFPEHLRSALAACDVLLTVIGPNWDGEERRIMNEGDFVRLEVKSGLERGIPVIPIFVAGGTIPEAGDLPPDLQELRSRNGMKVREDENGFEDDLTELSEGIVVAFEAIAGATSS